MHDPSQSRTPYSLQSTFTEWQNPAVSKDNIEGHPDPQGKYACRWREVEGCAVNQHLLQRKATVVAAVTAGIQVLL